jgi:rpsU-divergently transcribed protein
VELNAVNEKKMLSPRLLQASLKHVGRHGWTKDAIAQGAIDLNLPPIFHGIFVKGSMALVEEHMRQSNEEMKRELDEYLSNNTAAGEEKNKSKKDIVEFAIWSRLKRTIPVQTTWAQAMAVGARPENISLTMRLLTDMADIIAKKLNENDNNSNQPRKNEDDLEWYTNRAAITAAYCASELYMISDYSQDFENTKQFLNRRIVNDGSRFMQATYGLTDVLNTFTSGVGAGANTGFKMGLDVVESLLPKNLPLPSKMPFPIPSNFPMPLGSVFEILKSALPPNSLYKDDQTESRQHQKEHVYDDGKDDAIVDANLPEGLSLFGLVSRDVKEASDIITENNPDFTVVIWPMWEEIPTEVQFQDSRRVVRLVHDKQNIVVDVLRV